MPGQLSVFHAPPRSEHLQTMTITITFAEVVAAVIFCAVLLVALEVRRKHLTVWIGSYLNQRVSRGRGIRLDEPIHIMFCLVDHFEPLSGPTSEAEGNRLRIWLEEYPKLASRHKDSDGKPPQHSWFYPGEVYDAGCLETLTELARAGYGEVELHLHHAFDTPERLRGRLETAVTNFVRHGALVTNETQPQITYGFIHGNMGLNNSLGVGACGVDNELPILRDTGCYADFSMPTAPCRSQTRKINAIYYAKGIPGQPKSHDDGVDVELNRPPSGDLMIIQGPLAFNWTKRKYGILPRLENAEIQDSNPATPSRIRTWVAQHVHVKGRENWIMVKASCHGAEDRSRDAVLGDQADRMYRALEEEYRERPGYQLHYVTARELYNIIKAAEAGMKGNPGLYRDYVIARYRNHP